MKDVICIFLKNKVLLVSVVISLATAFLFPSAGQCNCQKLGEYCGSPSTETFPACCPFDTDSNDENQTALECKNVDNGVGTCESVESEEVEEAEQEE